MAAEQWTLEFYDAATYTLQVTFPANDLQFRRVLKDVGTGSFTVPLSHPDMAADVIAPFSYDFKLKRGTSLVMDGIVTSANWSSDKLDVVTFAFEDYAGLFNRRYYPFDPLHPYHSDPAGLYYPNLTAIWVDIDYATIAEDILTETNNADAYGISGFSFSNTATGQTTRYRIEPGDSSSILQHIKNLADEDNSFDFQFLNKSFDMFAPTRGEGSPVHTFDNTDDSVISINWTNNGPRATFTYGYGAGTASRLGSTNFYAPSEALYRRIEEAQDFGDTANRDRLDRLTASQGFISRFPQKELSLTVRANDISNFWTTLLGPGKRIAVQWQIPNYHLIDAEFRILAMSGSVSKEGEERCTFELEQIYA